MRIIFLILLLPVLVFSQGITDKHKSVIARMNVAEVGGSTIDTIYSAAGTGNNGIDASSFINLVDYTLTQIHDFETRNESESSSYAYIQLNASTTQDQFDETGNFAITFNVSALDGYTIDSLQFYIVLDVFSTDMGDFDISIVDMDPDPGDFTNFFHTGSEMNNYGTKFATENTADMPTDPAYHVFNLDANGISNFESGASGSGYVAYILDVDDILDETLNDFTWGSGQTGAIYFRTTDFADATSDPFLRIVYH